jgi:hypothetical protein
LASQRTAHDEGLQLGIIRMSPPVEHLLRLTNTRPRLQLRRPSTDRWSPFADPEEPHIEGHQQLTPR